MTPSVFMPGKGDTVWSPIFDTLTFAAAAQIGTDVRFFNHALGSSGANITNMRRPNEFASPEQLLCYAMRISLVSCSAADYVSLNKSYTFRLIVGGDKSYMEGPVEYFNSGMGLYGFGANVAPIVQNGSPDRTAGHSTSSPIPLGSGINFYVTMLGASFAPVADIVLRVYLDGPHTRPVQ